MITLVSISVDLNFISRWLQLDTLLVKYGWLRKATNIWNWYWKILIVYFLTFCVVLKKNPIYKIVYIQLKNADLSRNKVNVAILTCKSYSFFQRNFLYNYLFRHVSLTRNIIKKQKKDPVSSFRSVKYFKKVWKEQ